MPAITPGDAHGSLNGATAVTVVAAPGASTTRAVRQLYVFNRDTADVLVTLYKTVSGTDYYVDRQPALPPGQAWRVIDGDDVLLINGTTESLRVVMSGAPATTNPNYVASWIDRS